MTFFDRLKEARIHAGLTQEQLAARLGIAKSTLSGYESGNREPTISTIAKALEILSIDANYLYQDEAALDGQLSWEEMSQIRKYRALDGHGREVVDFLLEKEHARCAAKPRKTVSFEAGAPVLNAAHTRTDIDVTAEMIAHDEDIMDDENF